MLVLPVMVTAGEDDSPEAIGERLRAARVALGYGTKEEFAARAGLTQQTYGPWENGRREITREGAKALRKTYGLSLDFIYFGNMDALPHRIAIALGSSPSVRSTQKSSGKPD